MPLLIMKEFKGKIVSLLQNLWRLYEVMVDCILLCDIIIMCYRT